MTARARVLLASHDAGGTVPPMLALAEALVERGHQVMWLGQPSIEGRARAAGCDFTAFAGLSDYAPGVPIEEQLPIAVPLIMGADVGEQFVSVAERHGADLVVVDANLAGCAAAAETLEARSAVLLHSMLATFTQTWFADIWPFVGAGVNETRRRFGLGESNSWIDVFASHDRIISVVPRRFDAPDPDLPGNVRHFGFLIPRTSGGGDGRFADGENPTVLVGLSTTYQAQEGLLQAILDALGSLPVRGLASTAGQVDREALRCPSNVVVREFVDHGTALDQTDVMVTHAGLGSVAGALSHGVPLVCMPLGRDQHLNAERVERMGAGVQIDAGAAAAAIADAVQRVLEDRSYHEAASQLALESRAEGGATAAAEELEGLLG